jgi:hypothetical protein
MFGIGSFTRDLLVSRPTWVLNVESEWMVSGDVKIQDQTDGLEADAELNYCLYYSGTVSIIKLMLCIACTDSSNDILEMHFIYTLGYMTDDGLHWTDLLSRSYNCLFLE